MSSLEPPFEADTPLPPQTGEDGPTPTDAGEPSCAAEHAAADPLPAGGAEADTGEQTVIETAESPAASAWPDVVGSLAERLEEAQRLMGRQVEHADRLHAENQRLRTGELRAALLPLVRDLLRLHDDLRRMIDGADDEHSRDLEIVRTSLLDALARNGLVSIEPTLGEAFDPKWHSAAGVLATEDASLDRTIAEVARIGFRWEDNQLVRAAETHVFKVRTDPPITTSPT
ncbi:MAG TPA: nucleotide exchange factor GrpE [Solirubrobacteraceae bacterium]|nr:nucleotide exchange factor GrpE [Solirubrobacteraceae bacterium]